MENINDEQFDYLCRCIQENIDARKSSFPLLGYCSEQIVSALFNLNIPVCNINEFLKHSGKFNELWVILKNGKYFPIILKNGRMPDGSPATEIMTNENCFIPGNGGLKLINTIGEALILHCRVNTEDIPSLGFKNPFAEISNGIICDNTYNNYLICKDSNIFQGAMYRNPKKHSTGLTLKGLYSEIYAGVDDKPNIRIFQDKLQNFLPSEINIINDYINFDGNLFYVNSRAIKGFKIILSK